MIQMGISSYPYVDFKIIQQACMIQKAKDRRKQLRRFGEVYVIKKYNQPMRNFKFTNTKMELIESILGY